MRSISRLQVSCFLLSLSFEIEDVLYEIVYLC
jgi:hypothetical protein